MIKMKVEELKIGNYVSHEDYSCESFIVTSIELDDYGYAIMTSGGKNGEWINSVDIVTPIPLTEEWLLKFGWDKLELIDRTIGYNKYALFIGYRNHNLRLMGSNIHIINIKYVHQLQNIFYALTNEELILKQ
jgi:hypothetical protein